MPPPLIDVDPADLWALEEETRQKSRESVLSFTVYTHPDYRVNWHHRLIARKLDDIIAGRLRHLIVTCPPRQGKSELISRRFPAFAFGVNPDIRIIATSYTNDLAMAISRDVQRVMGTPEYKEIFPGAGLNWKGAYVGDESWKKTANEFEIVGHAGYYKCAGIIGGVTGRGADILLIDDPIKGREDAESRVKRERIWGTYLDDLKTRLDANGATVIVATRWHQDDLIGRVLAQMATDPESPKWEVLNLPARLDDPGHPEDPRGIGDILWPWWYSGKKDGVDPAEQHRLAKLVIDRWEKENPYGFASLGQQRPTPKTGEFFKPERITIVDAAPAKRVKTVRYWDKAGTQDAGKYTAGVKISKLSNGQFIIEHVVRGRWSALRREQIISDMADVDGKDCAIWVEQEPGSGGKESAEATIRNMAGYNIHAERVTGAKESRAQEFSAQVEGGNVIMIRGDWNQAYKDELRYFPLGTYSDQVDASSGAFNKLAVGRRLYIDDAMTLG